MSQTYLIKYGILAKYTSLLPSKYYSKQPRSHLIGLTSACIAYCICVLPNCYSISNGHSLFKSPSQSRSPSGLSSFLHFLYALQKRHSLLHMCYGTCIFPKVHITEFLFGIDWALTLQIIQLEQESLRALFFSPLSLRSTEAIFIQKIYQPTSHFSRMIRRSYLDSIHYQLDRRIVSRIAINVIPEKIIVITSSEAIVFKINASLSLTLATTHASRNCYNKTLSTNIRSAGRKEHKVF